SVFTHFVSIIHYWTARGFDLLRFRPGPVHPSLDNLVVPGSPWNTISIPNLAWTPVHIVCCSPELLSSLDPPTSASQ
uniref:Uncharacterized protein n=1 Tax=Oncorhynchus kisutch TaxID=8019 RepID=A0A8C7HGT8_ONCKI